MECTQKNTGVFCPRRQDIEASRSVRWESGSESLKKKNRRMTKKKKELHPPAGIFASCGFSWGTQKVWKARLGWSKLAGCVSPDLCSWQTLDPCSWPLGKLYTYRSIHPHHLNETIMQLDSLKSFKIVENSKYWAGHYSLL